MTGSDIFWHLQQRLCARGAYRVFFLGATDSVLDALATCVSRDFPGLQIAGTYAPPYRETFSELDSAAMIEAINAVRPDVLWVGMSAPKQEKWLHQHLPSLEVRFAAAIGAVFDYYSGRIRRPSAAVQAMGFEWLPRFMQEPARLWRRNLISTPVFLWHLLRYMVAIAWQRRL